ncbi:MAG: hypothetical protein RL095_3123 [Verrucomicrobiota bacterium]|jgi:predicted CoA-binding protein
MSENDFDTLRKNFFAGQLYAVAGASSNRDKYGNITLRWYMERHWRVMPLNPAQSEIEGLPAYPFLQACPEVPHGVSLVTPPQVSQKVVRDAIELGVKALWFQPGSEHPEAIAEARAAGLTVIADGPCILVSGLRNKS